MILKMNLNLFSSLQPFKYYLLKERLIYLKKLLMLQYKNSPNLSFL